MHFLTGNSFEHIYLYYILHDQHIYSKIYEFDELYAFKKITTLFYFQMLFYQMD